MHSRKYTGTGLRNGSLTTESVLQCPPSPKKFPRQQNCYCIHLFYQAGCIRINV